jgi:hypothetical protein
MKYPPLKDYKAQKILDLHYSFRRNLSLSFLLGKRVTFPPAIIFSRGTMQELIDRFAQAKSRIQPLLERL